jgi:hypothetical protein
MPSNSRTIRTDVPVETAIGLVLVGLLTGALAGDVVVGLLFFVLALLVYLLYRILRTVELIAAKL